MPSKPPRPPPWLTPTVIGPPALLNPVPHHLILSPLFTHLLPAVCSALPHPPTPSHTLLCVAGKGGPGQPEQVRLWKGFLAYERSNPQRLEPGPLNARVELAYMQALMCLLHFPEVRGRTARECTTLVCPIACTALCTLLHST